MTGEGAVADGLAALHGDMRRFPGVMAGADPAIGFPARSYSCGE